MIKKNHTKGKYQGDVKWLKERQKKIKKKKMFLKKTNFNEYM